MTGRISAAAFVAGAAWLQTRAALPSAWTLLWWALPGLLAAAALACHGGRRVARLTLSWLALPWLALWAGVALAVWHAQERLADALPLADEMRVARVVMQVVGLAQGDASGWRFEARVLRATPARVPEHIEVSWYAPGRYSPYSGAVSEAVSGAVSGLAARSDGHAPALPAVRPGQIWQAALVLRRPHGTLNPHGFDYEGWMFQRGIRARGTVRGMPTLLADQPWSGLEVAVARLRHVVRERLREALAGQRYGAVLIALALGDQAGVAASDWQTFNRTGITHLVSISGLHVTMVAAMLGLAVSVAWRRWRWRGRALAQWLPAQTAGIVAATVAALVYCLLAGWGVPARRTFFMLAVAALALVLRLPCSPSRVLAAAACVVVALDPWATVAPGFWLSFGAVAVLLLMAAGMAREPAPGRQTARPIARPWWQRAAAGLTLAARVQVGIALALTAPLAFFFQQAPVTTPLANALAIPVVSFAVTPLALLAAGLSMLPGGQWLAFYAAQLGHAIFAALMVPISGLADVPWSLLHVAASSWPWFALALAGTVMALLPRGWPLRQAGWLLLLPLLTSRAPPLAPGQWRWTALDVGQGMAVVVQTASATLLYDTGVRHSPTSDQGARVVVPFLRGLGVWRLDVLVLSHADLDHVGGARSLLQALPVVRSVSSFDLDGWLKKEARLLGAIAAAKATPEPLRPAHMARCSAGLAWQVDEVRFEFLHPRDDTGQGGNDDSCVLRVQGRHHAALLAGDISAATERQLAASSTLHADLVLMPHHGAAGSSSAALIAATHARHAVAQVGRDNRYGHPAPEVLARWQHAGATVWRSDRHGAVTAVSRADGLTVSAHRHTHRRYWHGQ